MQHVCKTKYNTKFRFLVYEESDEMLRKENVKLKNNINEMEKCVTERIGYLERHKSVSLHKIGM